MIRCGCRVTAAILVMEMLLVLLAIIASGRTICASSYTSRHILPQMHS